MNLGWKQSGADECLYFKRKVASVCKLITEEIADLKIKFEITEEGTITDYVGVHIEKMPDDKFYLN